MEGWMVGGKEGWMKGEKEGWLVGGRFQFVVPVLSLLFSLSSCLTKELALDNFVLNHRASFSSLCFKPQN